MLMKDCPVSVMCINNIIIRAKEYKDVGLPKHKCLLMKRNTMLLLGRKRKTCGLYL